MEQSGQNLGPFEYSIPENAGFHTDFEAHDYLKLLERDESFLLKHRDTVINSYLMSF
jgi:hypothetical protein